MLALFERPDWLAVDLAQTMCIADASSVTDAIKKFEDMDGDLASAADPVAQPCGARKAVLGAEFGDVSGER